MVIYCFDPIDNEYIRLTVTNVQAERILSYPREGNYYKVPFSDIFGIFSYYHYNKIIDCCSNCLYYFTLTAPNYEN